MDKSEVVAIIRSLLTSTTCSSYSVALLNKDFKSETGIDIPLFGYKRVCDFLYSIPDTVKVTGIYPIQKVHLVSNERSAHIESLVKRQKNTDNKPKSFSYKSRGKKGFIHSRISKPQNFCFQHQKKMTSDHFEEGTSDPHFVNRISKPQNFCFQHQKKMTSDHFEEGTSDPHFVNRNRRPQNFYFQYQKKMTSDHFEEETNDLQTLALLPPEKLSEKVLSAGNLSEEKLSERTLLEENSSEKTLLEENLSEKEKTLLEENLSEKEKALSEENLSEIMLPAETLSEKRVSPEKLSPQRLSVEKILAKTLSTVRFSPKKCYKKKLSPRANSALPFTIGADVPLEDCLFTRKSIPFIDINLYAEVGKYTEVCPCKIVNPHKFYFHLRKLNIKFSIFMRNLQCFYSTYENFPRLSNEMLKANFFCAAFYKVSQMPMWHRAEICSVSKSRVTVRLIDQGETVRVSKSKLKYLHRDFASFPRQALLGYLANIKPSNGDSKWSDEAGRRFSDLALEKELIAGVVCIRNKHHCIKMALSCTKGVEIHINDTLVSEGYAEFTENVLKSHSAIDLTVLNSSKASEKKVGESEFVIKLPSSESLAEISRSLENYVSTKPKSPIFYNFNYNACNTRLRQLFSAQMQVKKEKIKKTESRNVQVRAEQ